MPLLLARIVTIAFLWFVFHLPKAFADVAPDPLQTGIIPTPKVHRVQMLLQDITIDLAPDWSQINARFILLNRGHQAVLMEVGFPTSYRDEIKDLIVKRNNKLVAIREVAEWINSEIKGDKAKYNWALWDMRFAPEERVELLVSYQIKPRHNYGDIITPYRMTYDQIVADLQGKCDANDLLEKLLQSMQTFSTGYIMVTGAGWYGPIGEAYVKIKHPNGAEALRWISPSENFTVTSSGVAYSFTHINPDFDIAVEFNQYLTLTEEETLTVLLEQACGLSDGLRFHREYLKQMRGVLQLLPISSSQFW